MSFIKRIYRYLLPENVRSEIRARRFYVHKFGLFKGLIVHDKISGAKDGVMSLSIPQCRNPILLRANTSDISVFRQIFLDEEYDVRGIENPRFIVDGGANIGCSTLYFGNKYPDALIFAIEPEESNYEMLKKNTSHYPNIKTIKAAIWDKKTFLKIDNPGDKKWSFRVQECENNTNACIETISIDELLSNSPGGIIDILKLDIEGAEKQIFLNSPAWIEKVDTLLIELHERYSEGCTEVFYKAISKYHFRESVNGEKIILQRHRCQ